jgi:hypothetical protein
VYARIPVDALGSPDTGAPSPAATGARLAERARGGRATDLVEGGR